MQGLSSYVVTCRSVIRVQAHTAQDAEDAALEILRRDGPDDIDVERTDGNDHDNS
jgi:hypothetical protein